MAILSIRGSQPPYCRHALKCEVFAHSRFGKSEEVSAAVASSPPKTVPTSQAWCSQSAAPARNSNLRYGRRSSRGRLRLLSHGGVGDDLRAACVSTCSGANAETAGPLSRQASSHPGKDTASIPLASGRLSSGNPVMSAAISTLRGKRLGTQLRAELRLQALCASM